MRSLFSLELLSPAGRRLKATNLGVEDGDGEAAATGLVVSHSLLWKTCCRLQWAALGCYKAV
jgi:hypothetical protein